MNKSDKLKIRILIAMPSPFLGMDPYLEGDLWSDVHHELASQIRRQLTPQISPKYVARIERYVIKDETPETEVGIMYPDVDVFLNHQVKEPIATYKGRNDITPISFSIPAIQPVEIRIPVIEIRDVQGNQLITAIEVISPVNKKGKGLIAYRAKRQQLLSAGVHFLEIDLLRRGTRTIEHQQLANTDYLIALSRVPFIKTDIWSFSMVDTIPIIPVPLQAEDQDAILDLKIALETIYEEAAYHLTIDYQKDPPPPALSPNQRENVAQILSESSK